MSREFLLGSAIEPGTIHERIAFHVKCRESRLYRTGRWPDHIWESLYFRDDRERLRDALGLTDAEVEMRSAEQLCVIADSRGKGATLTMPFSDDE